MRKERLIEAIDFWNKEIRVKDQENLTIIKLANQVLDSDNPKTNGPRMSRYLKTEGATTIPAQVIKRIADYIGCSADYLLDRTDKYYGKIQFLKIEYKDHQKNLKQTIKPKANANH